jgi:hypothetical protein
MFRAAAVRTQEEVAAALLAIDPAVAGAGEMDPRVWTAD